jgi:hypothetical protein
MLSIDDARAGEYQEALNNAAVRFWRKHVSESFSVASAGSGREGFQVSIRRFGDKQASLLVVRITDDPEGAIFAALECWWGDRRPAAGTNRVPAVSS